MDLIFIGIGMALLLYIIKKIYTKNWSKGISVEIKLSESEVYPGEEVLITEIITNNKWLPLPMIKVKFAIDKSLESSDVDMDINVSDKCYKSEVFSILFYQKITRRLPFKCTKRGYYPIDSVDVVSTDLFMDSVLATVFPMHQWITVYPEPINSEDVDIPYNRIMGAILAKRYTYEDPFEFLGIREYQTYDTMKSINWNASARSGELKVNIHDYTASQEVCILLNLEDEGIWEYEVLKEKSISMACSLSYRLTLQGIGVGIISNGADKITGDRLYIASGSDEGHRKTIITGLSRIDLKKGMKEFADLMEEQRRQMDKASMIVMISTCKKNKLQEEYKRFVSGFAGDVWICPVHPEMNCEFKKVDSNSIIKWEVPV